jgi:hypothetical protein
MEVELADDQVLGRQRTKLGKCNPSLLAEEPPRFQEHEGGKNPLLGLPESRTEVDPDQSVRYDVLRNRNAGMRSPQSP